MKLKYSLLQLLLMNKGPSHTNFRQGTCHIQRSGNLILHLHKMTTHGSIKALVFLFSFVEQFPNYFPVILHRNLTKIWCNTSIFLQLIHKDTTKVFFFQLKEKLLLCIRKAVTKWIKMLTMTRCNFQITKATLMQLEDLGRMASSLFLICT